MIHRNNACYSITITSNISQQKQYAKLTSSLLLFLNPSSPPSSSNNIPWDQVQTNCPATSVTKHYAIFATVQCQHG